MNRQENGKFRLTYEGVHRVFLLSFFENKFLTGCGLNIPSYVKVLMDYLRIKKSLTDSMWTNVHLLILHEL